MAANFRTIGHAPPAHIASEPQKEQPPEKVLQAGVQNRSFSDEELKQAFDTFDLDKNRFVGASELSALLKLVGEDATDREIDEMIRLCDTDGDGQVTFDEFHRLMAQTSMTPPALPDRVLAKQKAAPKAQSKLAAEYQNRATLGGARMFDQPGQQTAAQLQQQQKKKMQPGNEKANRGMTVEMLVKKLSGGLGKIKPSQIKKVYRRFQDIDTDQSGAIEYPEFIAALDMEDSSVSRQMFKVFDMDGSGRIELKEFIVVLSRYTSAAQSEKMKFAFMMFDEDGSGFIEKDELIQMLSSTFVVEGLSQEELEDRADMVFNFLGKQKDDAISYEDFIKLSSAQNGLIYPVEEKRHVLGQGLSINALLAEARGDKPEDLQLPGSGAAASSAHQRSSRGDSSSSNAR